LFLLSNVIVGRYWQLSCSSQNTLYEYLIINKKERERKLISTHFRDGDAYLPPQIHPQS
jgi:hypothetical protein